MDYLSFSFYILICIVIVIYYALPLRFRWIVLLLGSLTYYLLYSKVLIVILLFTAAISFYGSKLIEQSKSPTIRRIYLILTIILVLLPLIICKYSAFLLHIGGIELNKNILVPLGISFYTLQIIAYCVDIYKKRYSCENSLLRYILFVSFFPQILQGPIPRFNVLSKTLYEGHRFNDREFSYGLQLIVWGFFLKLMIADKSAIVANCIFDNYTYYNGLFYLVAGVFYTIQLYTDFLGCVTISQGVAALFGVKLTDNFKHPYFSRSIKEFWGRWHISLSSWLKDYVYIPLGGNRKGRLHKYINILIVFFISGLWHCADGHGFKYIFWGLLNGIYQIAGDISGHLKSFFLKLFKISQNSKVHHILQCLITFTLSVFAWIIFRAKSFKIAMYMIKSIFTDLNVWILFNDELLNLGLDLKDYCVLFLSILFLLVISMSQEKNICIRDTIARQNIVIRYIIYLLALFIIIIFGTYGFGYDAGSFIYGGF